MSSTGPTVYAMYLRKSEMDVKWQQKNPDGEDPLARHERKLRRLARANGGVVGEVFADPDITASNEDVHRPDFERLLAELPRFGGLLAMDIDRITRNSPKLEEVNKVFTKNPHLKFLVPDPDRNPDLTTPEGRNEARDLVIRANRESLATARRMREWHEDLRETATPHNGVPGFGMANSTDADRKQVELIGAAARDVLAGLHANAIAKAWRDAGVKTPRGKEWTGMQVGRMLRSPRMAGYRVHKGDRYRLEESGEWAMCGPVILNEATWVAVVAELDKQAADKAPRRARRSYLLSGFLTCGVCSGSMTGNVWADGVRYSYTCNKGCVGIAGHQLDRHLEKLLLKRWAEADAVTVEESGAGPNTAERERLESLNADLMAAMSAGNLALDDVMPQVKKNRTTIDTIKAEEQAHARRRARREAASTNPAEKWQELKAKGDLEHMLNMVRQEFGHLVIQSAKESGRRWDDTRVRALPA